jgi:carbon-monoxide dehydrogenase medium subunit/xanthine dehydrogenase FAD-binding subunit
MNYYRPKNIDEAKRLLQKFAPDSRIIAGGTDLLVEMRHPNYPLKEHLIDISKIESLNKIGENGNEIVIGSAAVHDQIANHPLIKRFAPLLSAACSVIGSQQIRNRGTIGGNICNASPCADTVPALIALEAKVKIVSPRQEREIPISSFFHKPYHTVIKENEILTEIRFPKLNDNQRCAFYKLARRKALAISRINIAAILKISKDHIIEEARLAPGSVFPTWTRINDAESFLSGKKLRVEIFKEAGNITAKKMIEVSGRRWSTPYKEPVIAALVKRVLMMAAGDEFSFK